MITIDTAEKTITIHAASSDARVQIEAPQGTIALAAQTIEITSTGETKIVAQGGLTLDGRPGTTTLQGLTVNIN